MKNMYKLMAILVIPAAALYAMEGESKGLPAKPRRLEGPGGNIITVSDDPIQKKLAQAISQSERELGLLEQRKEQLEQMLLTTDPMEMTMIKDPESKPELGDEPLTTTAEVELRAIKSQQGSDLKVLLNNFKALIEGEKDLVKTKSYYRQQSEENLDAELKTIEDLLDKLS